MAREPALDAPDAAVELALAMKRLRARLRAEANPSEGWTISQLGALGRIVREGPITTSRLAHAEHVRPQSMAAIVATLRDEGLVVGAADPHDGRKTLLSASVAGRKLVAERNASRSAWLTGAIEALAAEGRADVVQETIVLLNALADHDVDARRGARR